MLPLRLLGVGIYPYPQVPSSVHADNNLRADGLCQTKDIDIDAETSVKEVKMTFYDTLTREQNGREQIELPPIDKLTPPPSPLHADFTPMRV